MKRHHMVEQIQTLRDSGYPIKKIAEVLVTIQHESMPILVPIVRRREYVLSQATMRLAIRTKIGGLIVYPEVIPTLR